MRAYVSKIIDGKVVQTGTQHRTITKEYTTEYRLLKYGVKPLLKSGESAQVEIFYNWERRYGKPDLTLIHCNGVNA